MSRRVLGIDPGTYLGWVVLEFDEDDRNKLPLICGHGRYHLKVGRFEGRGMVMLRFREWLKEIITLTEPDCLILEEVMRHAGTDAAHVYGAITHSILEVCELTNTPSGGVSVSTWKKHGTGKGNASKELVAHNFKIIADPDDIDDWDQDQMDSYFIGCSGANGLGWFA